MLRKRYRIIEDQYAENNQLKCVRGANEWNERQVRNLLDTCWGALYDLLTKRVDIVYDIYLGKADESQDSPDALIHDELLALLQSAS